jgi:hypothetical protein
VIEKDMSAALERLAREIAHHSRLYRGGGVSVDMTCCERY